MISILVFIVSTIGIFYAILIVVRTLADYQYGKARQVARRKQQVDTVAETLALLRANRQEYLALQYRDMQWWEQSFRYELGIPETIDTQEGAYRIYTIPERTKR